mmetsp:Transcript_26920/g.62559  ORF Transcript_26920/g.62559 Transcript_26920/m.62559 type:complete len:329 (-) Transcript_26920:219-1205(-)
MKVDAPNASAIAPAALFAMPPSAITGTLNSLAYRATWYTALPSGRPTAGASCGDSRFDPMPTLSPSTPACNSGCACFGVTTLPAMTSREWNCCFTFLMKSTCSATDPWEASRNRTSIPASTKQRTRSSSDSFGRTEAPTSSCRFASIAAFGKFFTFFRSDLVTSATSSPSSLRMGSLPFLLWTSLSSASPSEMGSQAVMHCALGVMTAESLVLLSSTKSMSRLVTMPKNLLPIMPMSVMQTVDASCVCLMLSKSATVCVCDNTKGSMMKPFSHFLTRSTCLACSAAEQLQCMTPIPPMRAHAMAMLASVTVSIGAATSGAFSVTFFDS